MLHGEVVSTKAKFRDLFAISVHSFPASVYNLLSSLREHGAQLICCVYSDVSDDSLIYSVPYHLNLQSPHFEFYNQAAKEEDALYQFSPAFPDLDGLYFRFYVSCENLNREELSELCTLYTMLDLPWNSQYGYALYSFHVPIEALQALQVGSYLGLSSGKDFSQRIVYHFANGTYSVACDVQTPSLSSTDDIHMIECNTVASHIIASLSTSTLPIASTFSMSSLSSDGSISPASLPADPKTPTGALTMEFQPTDVPTVYPSVYKHHSMTQNFLQVTSPVQPTSLNEYARRLVELVQYQSIYTEQQHVGKEQIEECDAVARKFPQFLGSLHGKGVPNTVENITLENITLFSGVSMLSHIQQYGMEDLPYVVESQEEELQAQESFLTALENELSTQEDKFQTQIDEWYASCTKHQLDMRASNAASNSQLQIDLVKYIQSAETLKQHQLRLRHRESSLLNEQIRLFPVTSGPSEDCKRDLIEAVLASQKKSKHPQLRIALSQRLELHFSNCGDRVWYIRGIPLFLARAMLPIFTPEMREATCIALGFIVQLVVLLTKYLRCSLTYPLTYRGSRSLVVVNEQTPPFPLFLKPAADKNMETAFLEAVNYLNTNVVHLIEARLRPEIASEAKHQGLYLIENLHLLLTHEIASN